MSLIAVKRDPGSPDGWGGDVVGQSVGQDGKIMYEVDYLGDIFILSEDEVKIVDMSLGRKND